MEKTIDSPSQPFKFEFEWLLFPLLLPIPYYVLNELMNGVKKTASPTSVIIAMLLAALVFSVPVYLGRLRTTQKPLSLLASAFLSETIFFVCFFIIFSSQESFRLPQQTLFQITVSFAVVIFIAQSALEGRISWRRNYLNLPIILILIYGMVSFIFSPSFWISLKDYVELLCIVILFWLIVHQWNERRHFDFIAIMAVIIAGLMGLIGVAQHFNFNEIYGLGHNLDPFSTLGNKNYVAELLAMTLPLVLGLIVVSDRLWRKALLWLAVESMLIIVVVAETRGSWIGLIAGLIVLLLYGIDNFDRRTARTLIFVIIVFIINSLVIMYLSQNQLFFEPGPTPYADRFLSMARVLNSELQKGPKMWAFAGAGVVVMLVISQIMMRTIRGRVTAAALVIALAFATYLGIKTEQNKEAAAAARQAAVAAAVAPSKTENDRKKKNNVKSGENENTEEVITDEEGQTAKVLDDSIESRRFIYGGSWQMVKHYPFGIGIGAFKVKYLTMLKSYLEAKKITTIPGFFKDVNAKEAHNEYLHTLAEQGPIGLLLLILFIIRLIQYFYRVYYRTRDTHTRMAVLGAFSGLVAVGTSAMLGFPFRIVPTAVICCIMLSLLVFADDRNAAAAALETGAPPPELDPRRRRILNFPIFKVLAVPIAFVFFGFTTVYSYNWQRAHILLKEGDAYMRAGDNYLNSGDKESARKTYAHAREILEQAAAMDSSNGEIFMKLGTFYQNLAQNGVDPEQNSEELFDKSIAEMKTSLRFFELPQTRLNLGAAFFHKGDMYFSKARSEPNPKKSQQYFDKGYGYFRQAEYEFNQTVNLYPNYSLPRFNLALILYEYAQREDEKANGINMQIWALRQRFLMPDEPDKAGIDKKIRGLDKQITTLKKNAESFYHKAEREFVKTIKIDPALVVANFKLAICYERLGRPDLARGQYEKTIKLTAAGGNDLNTLADAHYNLGIIYANESMDFASQSAAVNTAPADSTRLLQLQADYMRKARDMFVRTLELNGGHIKAHNNLANILYKEGDDQGAIDHYQAALDLAPQYPEAKLNLTLIKVGRAEMLSQKHDPEANFLFEESQRYAQELLYSNPDGSKLLKIYRILGICYKYLGDVNKANEYLTLAVTTFRGKPQQSEPDYAMAVINLAETRAQMGDKANAIKFLMDAVNNPVTSINQLRALRRLATWQFDAGQKDAAFNTFKRAMVYRQSNFNDAEFGDLVIQYAEKLYFAGRAADGLRLLEDYNRMPISNIYIKSALKYKLGEFYNALNRQSDATSAFTTIIDNNWPDTARAKIGLTKLLQTPRLTPEQQIIVNKMMSDSQKQQGHVIQVMPVQQPATTQPTAQPAGAQTPPQPAPPAPPAPPPAPPQ